MAGAVITILPKRVFDFSNLVAGGPSQQCIVAQRIDVSQFVDAVLVLRVHSAVASGGTIAFEIYGDGHTEEEPGLQFVTSGTLAAIGTTISSSVAAPVLQTIGNASGTTNVSGRYALFRVTGNRTSAFTLSATVSADLVLRSPDNTAPMARR
jgi:hypothetical protein